jgi:hypothetical protein
VRHFIESFFVGEDVFGVYVHVLQHFGKLHVCFTAVDIFRFLNFLCFLYLLIELPLRFNVTGDGLIFAYDGCVFFHSLLSVDLAFDGGLPVGVLADLLIVLIALLECFYFFAYFYFFLIEHREHFVEFFAALGDSYSMVLKG